MAPKKYDGFTIDGINLGYIFFTPDKIQSVIDYSAKPDDVFIVGFPKTGTNWTQQIIYLVQNKGQPPVNYADMNNKSFFMDISGADCLSTMERPLSLKTHLPFHLTPFHAHAKYVYIARNPFDVCVSFYHFIGSDYAIHDLSTFFEIFIDPNEAIYGDYFENLLSWWVHRHDPNVLFITYEEMLKNKSGMVLRIADFLDYRYGEQLKNDNNLLTTILNYSSFDYMKKTIDLPNLFRKGEAIGSTDNFNVDQINKMKNIFATKCNGTGLENLWPEVMK